MEGEGSMLGAKGDGWGKEKRHNDLAQHPVICETWARCCGGALGIDGFGSEFASSGYFCICRDSASGSAPGYPNSNCDLNV